MSSGSKSHLNVYMLHNCCTKSRSLPNTIVRSSNSDCVAAAREKAVVYMCSALSLLKWTTVRTVYSIGVVLLYSQNFYPIYHRVSWIDHKARIATGFEKNYHNPGFRWYNGVTIQIYFSYSYIVSLWDRTKTTNDWLIN